MSEVVGRRLPLEVDEDALDDVRRLDAPRRLDRLGDDVLVDAPSLEHAQQHVLADAAGHEVGVERVDVGVGLGVVAEERLVARGGDSPSLGHCARAREAAPAACSRAGP